MRTINRSVKLLMLTLCLMMDSVSEYRIYFQMKIRGIFTRISSENGIFVFNINGVDTKKASAGFVEYEEANGNNMITEWELSIILHHDDYLKRTIFHNGKVEFKQIKNGIALSWN